MLEILLSFIISLLIGLLIGIERERSHPEGVQPIGVRTFILFSLLGTLAATLNQPLFTISISTFVFGIILLGYLCSTSKLRKKIDIGITTEISAGMVFCLGYLVPQAHLVAITISAIVLLILLERKRLHELARKKLKTHEIESVIILIVFALGILPLLPNKVIDPWGFFNPRNFGILVVTIAAVQFGGYIAIRLFGERMGLALTGLLGGFVSSTAVFANLSHTLKTYPKSQSAIMASAIFSVLAMLVEVMIIVFVASQELFLFIIKPLFGMAVVDVCAAILLMKFQKVERHAAQPIAKPMNLSFLFLTSLVIAFTLVLIAVTKHYVGTEGILATSFLVGLFEIHGISLATSLLYLDHHLALEAARSVLYMALLATFVSKLFLLWIFTPIRFAWKTSLCLLVIVASGVLISYFTAST